LSIALPAILCVGAKVVVKVSVQVVFDIVAVELLLGAKHVDQLSFQIGSFTIAVATAPVVFLQFGRSSCSKASTTRRSAIDVLFNKLGLTTK
jgi:hypothetical protein